MPATLDPLWSRSLTEPAACEHEFVPYLRIEPAPTDGIAVEAGAGLRRIAPDGTLLWDTPPCPACDPSDPEPSFFGRPYIADFSLAASPATWIVESRGSFLDPPLQLALQRLDEQGDVAASVPLLPFAQGTRIASLRVMADQSGVTALVAAHPEPSGLPRLVWIRHDHGMPPVRREVEIDNAPASMSINAIKPLPDGGMLAAVQHQIVDMCAPLLHCDDDTRQLTWLRLAADGNERWRVAVDGFVPWPAVQPDGSAWLARHEHAIAHVDADGTLSAVMPVAGLEEFEAIFSIHGPVADHLLLVTDAGLRLVDLAGQLRASHLSPIAPLWADPALDNIAATEDGFLLPMLSSDGAGDCAIGTLLDPHSLQPRLVLRDEVACTADGFVPGDTSAQADGSVYIGGRARGNDTCELRVLRFGMPGTPAGGLLFRDGFGS